MSGIDVEIGRRLRALRQIHGMTMEQVASRVGVRYQQIQKYEAGANRVSAGRLLALARLFDVPIGAFFEKVEPASDRPTPDVAGLDSRGFRLAYEFDKLSEPQKLAVLSLVQSMSSGRGTSERQDGT